MIDDFVNIEPSSFLMLLSTESDCQYPARGSLTLSLRKSVVSMLCAMTSGLASTTVLIESTSFWKSGMSTSTIMPGFISFVARMVRAKCPAPPSGRSSLSTEVSTT